MHQKSRVAMAVAVLSSALSTQTVIAEAQSIALPGLRAFPESLNRVEPTSVTRVRSIAWVSEGQLAFFFDPSRKDLAPLLPFRIYAVPLTGEQTR
jgi:hypothetical protein